MTWSDCFSHNVQCCSLPFGNRKRCEEWHCLSQNVQCHSLAVGHRKGCDKIAFHNMCNVTYSLLVRGTDVIRFLFTKCAISFTFYWSWKKMWWHCLSQNVQCHLLSIGHRKTCDETILHKMCHVTHKLLKYVMRLLSQNVQCHSLAVDQRKWCNDTAFHKMWNATHFLLALIGADVTRMHFRNDQCHSLAVTHGKKCHNGSAFHKMWNTTDILLVIGK